LIVNYQDSDLCGRGLHNTNSVVVEDGELYVIMR
jgi:hypothetical protein